MIRRGIFLLMVWGLVTSAHADTAREQLQRFFADQQALRAEFQQTVTDAKGKRTQQVRGALALQRPGKFRWEYAAPYQQLIVTDGRKLWIYDRDLNQVIVKPVDKALGNTPAQLLSGTRPLAQDFTISEAGVRDGLAWVELTPFAKEREFERVQLGFAAGELRAMAIHDNFGQTTALQFSTPQRSATLPPTTFSFMPPAGVDVINE